MADLLQHRWPRHNWGTRSSDNQEEAQNK